MIFNLIFSILYWKILEISALRGQDIRETFLFFGIESIFDLLRTFFRYDGVFIFFIFSKLN